VSCQLFAPVVVTHISQPTQARARGPARRPRDRGLSGHLLTSATRRKIIGLKVRLIRGHRNAAESLSNPYSELAMTADDSALQLPAQTVPVPKSISAQGQAYLAAAAKRLSAEQASGLIKVAPLDQRAQAAAAVQFLRPLASRFQGSVDTTVLPSGAKLYRMTPRGRTGRLSKVAYVDIHGGGFTAGGGEMCELLAKIRASDYGAEVFAVDYRLLPEHPFPAALDDCVAAYKEILKHHDAGNLVLAGASAGGNLAAALVLLARDGGLPLPAAVLLQTPALDMTLSGDSVQTNRWLDVNLYGGGGGVASLYSAGTDPMHPYVSPLFGDFNRGWPRTLLTTGTRDLLLSDTVRMHRALRRAGVRAELHVAEASPHGGFMGANAPEDAEMIAECRQFVYSAWGIAV
jgi:monoterpene epsilon-lactone hydrolase